MREQNDEDTLKFVIIKLNLHNKKSDEHETKKLKFSQALKKEFSTGHNSFPFPYDNLKGQF